MLNLCSNQLAALPDSLRQLTQLRELYLQDNQLMGLENNAAVKALKERGCQVY
jgi:Leucine-rich repeat (LRR) protein